MYLFILRFQVTSGISLFSVSNLANYSIKHGSNIQVTLIQSLLAGHHDIHQR